MQKTRCPQTHDEEPGPVKIYTKEEIDQFEAGEEPEVTLLEKFCNIMTSQFLGREFTKKDMLESISSLEITPNYARSCFDFMRKAKYVQKTFKGIPLKKVLAKYTLTSPVDYDVVSKIKKDETIAYRRGTGVKPRKKFKEKVKRILVEGNHDLTKRMPYGLTSEIAVSLGTSRESITSIITGIRKEGGVNAPPRRARISIPVTNPFIDYLLENKFDRKMPKQSRAAYDKMIYALLDLPRGGAGLMIGTQEAFSATTHKHYCNQLLMDELEVGSFLKRTTDKDTPLTIIIGNLFHGGEQAKLKADHWRNNNITSDSTIIVEPIDRNSYTHRVDTFAQKNSLSKVIKIDSGLWGCSNSSKHKYNGHDFNFKDPSEYLTKVHRNLHILALTMENGSYDFNVRYLHDGKNVIL